MGNIPSEKTFTLDSITNTDDQISYIAGADEYSDTKGYTLEVILNSVDGTVIPIPNKNIAHLIGGLSVIGSTTDKHWLIIFSIYYDDIFWFKIIYKFYRLRW